MRSPVWEVGRVVMIHSFMVMGIFSKESFYLEAAIVYISSLTKAYTKFPKGKGIRKNPIRHRIIRNKSSKVLESCNSQCRNTGALLSSSGRRVVHARLHRATLQPAEMKGCCSGRQDLH